MTLQEFFDLISSDPSLLLFYFIALPVTAFLSGVFGRDEGHLTPWKQLYSFLVYAACIPGIFSITLNFYLFLFEQRSVMEANIFTQILPVIVMILTLWLIKRNIEFDEIPGFDKLSSLIVIIAIVLIIMWILDRTHIIAITFLPFYAVLLLLAGMFALIRICWTKLFSAN